MSLYAPCAFETTSVFLPVTDDFLLGPVTFANSILPVTVPLFVDSVVLDSEARRMPIRDCCASDFGPFSDADKVQARVRGVSDPMKLDRIPGFRVFKVVEARVMEAVEFTPAI